MEYRKIKVSFEEAPKRLYRELYVEKDISLFDLGCVILSSFGGAFEHLFLFMDQNHQYVPTSFLENGFEDDVPLTNYFLMDLGSSFEFIYDTGEDWRFKVKVYSKIEEKEFKGNPLAIYIDGKGLGIWEDNIFGLREYLNGTLKDGDESEEDNPLPWNLDCERFSDFDLPLDSGKINALMNSHEEDKERILEECYLPGVSYFENEKEDLADTLDDDEEEDIPDPLYEIVDALIDKVDYVHQAYEITKENYQDDAMARAYILGTLLMEFKMSANAHRVFDEEHYKGCLMNIQKETKGTSTKKTSKKKK